MSKNLSKNIAAFDNFDKTLFVLLKKSCDVSIALFATAAGAPVGIVIARVGLDFFISNQIKKTSQSRGKNTKSVIGKK